MAVRRRLTMRRILCLILAFVLLAGGLLTVLAEEDDSVIIPVDIEEPDSAEPETQPARNMKRGDSGDDVLFLQSRLKDLKYYSGELSGNYGDATREAVRAFQKDFDLGATGDADMQTQMILYTAEYRPLRYGSSGDDVRELQTQLTALGYYKGQIKGNFLEATQKAVERFQQNNSLRITGVADPDTQDVLFSGRAVGRYDSAAPTPTPIPDMDTYLVDEDESGVVMPAEPVAFSKQLKNGARGDQVKLLQQRLNELGYLDASKVSGSFLKYTTRAVKAIQLQNGLPSTGVVDEETWNVIFNTSRVVLPGHTPKPSPTPTPVAFYIVVDVRNQITSVYGLDEYGEYTVPVRQMLCSTGKVGTDSDPGDWVLTGRKANWCYFPKWGGYARYWTRINGSIAFHSIIYNSVSTGDPKVSSYKKLGQRASHGCIRLTVADAKWIYDNVGAGTIVHITRQNDTVADQELKTALKLPGWSTKANGPLSTPEPTPEPEYRSDVKPVLGGRKLKEKSQGEDVFWLQKRLKELGYYDTKCTGQMLNRTVAALKEFQKAHGLPANGVADQNVIDALWAAPVPTPRPTPTPWVP